MDLNLPIWPCRPSRSCMGPCFGKHYLQISSPPLHVIYIIVKLFFSNVDYYIYETAYKTVTRYQIVYACQTGYKEINGACQRKLVIT